MIVPHSWKQDVFNSKFEVEVLPLKIKREDVFIWKIYLI